MALDPTTFAILRSSFINIANEMGLTLGKVAYSPVITEGRDFAGAIYDANGHLVACGEHDLTGLLGTMEPTIHFIFDWLGKENLHEGDVVFVGSVSKTVAHAEREGAGPGEVGHVAVFELDREVVPSSSVARVGE